MPLNGSGLLRSGRRGGCIRVFGGFDASRADLVRMGALYDMVASILIPPRHEMSRDGDGMMAAICLLIVGMLGNADFDVCCICVD